MTMIYLFLVLLLLALLVYKARRVMITIALYAGVLFAFGIVIAILYLLVYGPILILSMWVIRAALH